MLVRAQARAQRLAGDQLEVFSARDGLGSYALNRAHASLSILLRFTFHAPQ